MKELLKIIINKNIKLKRQFNYLENSLKDPISINKKAFINQKLTFY